MEQQQEGKNIWMKEKQTLFFGQTPRLKPERRRAKVHQRLRSALVYGASLLGPRLKFYGLQDLAKTLRRPPPLIRCCHVIPRPLLSRQGRFFFFFRGGLIRANWFFPLLPSQRTPSLSPLAGFAFFFFSRCFPSRRPDGRRLVPDACRGESMIRLLIRRLVVKSRLRLKRLLATIDCDN